MTYTVAVVDQGLLNLTRFETPEPWAHFFKREALGVRTWDLFDEVAGAYGGAFDRLLSIGGDDILLGAGQNNRNRFPPMVRIIGPFELKRGATSTHDPRFPNMSVKRGSWLSPVRAGRSDQPKKRSRYENR